MKNAENITIVMLLAAAAILSAMLIGTYWGTSQSADAEVSSRRMGFIVSTGRVGGFLDAVYIIDTETKKLNAYVPAEKGGTLEFVATADLERAFQRK